MDAISPPDIYLFDDFRLDRRGGGLFRCAEAGDPVRVSLGSRALDVLRVLIERHGDLVPKDELMAAVWPNTVVEEANLTVQISTLRRVLDNGRPGPGCIQTAPGRGYRFVAAVTRLDQVAVAEDSLASAAIDGPARIALKPDPVTADGAQPAVPVASRGLSVARRPAALAIAGLLLLGIGAAWWLTGDRSRPVDQTPVAPAQSASAFPAAAAHPSAPRLSLVVLPFKHIGDDPRDTYLADGITDDLTTDLSHIAQAFVIARETAYTYRGKATDVRQIGRELGVRYVLEGSVRRIDATLKVNAQLISAETGAHLWSDRFDEEISELGAGQEQVVTRMRAGLGISMVEIEKARSLRERPTNPDAFDLILRARSLENLPPNLQRNNEALSLYELALSLDPTSAYATRMVAVRLINKSYPSWETAENMQRVEMLVSQARAIAPDAEGLLNLMIQWYRKLERNQEAMAVAEDFIRRFPNNFLGYASLATSKIFAGHAEEAIPLEEKAIQLNPRSSYLFNRYRQLGFASLLLGRDKDAITFLERSLAINPDDDGGRQWIYRFLAAAYAQSGQLAAAKHAVAEADRLWPYDTVRSHWPDDLSSHVYAEQVRRLQAGLRLVGERDHADEEADFGVPSDAALRNDFAGLTPTAAPGARTIRTTDLAKFLVLARPVVIDTVSYSWGRSMPGAVGLKFAGLGGSLTDRAQDRLRSKMRELTAGDLSRPIVAVGWNSERFDGRNLVLRLVALGYTQVYWYRGGREAWEVAEQPETELALQDW
jgi:TolB-like protein/DNA-binding winged helix-turn-helix (wHTH) protein